MLECASARFIRNHSGPFIFLSFPSSKWLRSVADTTQNVARAWKEEHKKGERKEASPCTFMETKTNYNPCTVPRRTIRVRLLLILPVALYSFARSKRTFIKTRTPPILNGTPKADVCEVAWQRTARVRTHVDGITNTFWALQATKARGGTWCFLSRCSCIMKRNCSVPLSSRYLCPI